MLLAFVILLEIQVERVLAYKPWRVRGGALPSGAGCDTAFGQTGHGLTAGDVGDTSKNRKLRWVLPQQRRPSEGYITAGSQTVHIPRYDFHAAPSSKILMGLL